MGIEICSKWEREWQAEACPKCYQKSPLIICQYYVSWKLNKKRFFIEREKAKSKGETRTRTRKADADESSQRRPDPAERIRTNQINCYKWVQLFPPRPTPPTTSHRHWTLFMCFSFDFSFAKLICNFWSSSHFFFGFGCFLAGNMNNSAYDCVLGRISLCRFGQCQRNGNKCKWIDETSRVLFVSLDSICASMSSSCALNYSCRWGRGRGCCERR